MCILKWCGGLSLVHSHADVLGLPASHPRPLTWLQLQVEDQAAVQHCRVLRVTWKSRRYSCGLRGVSQDTIWNRYNFRSHFPMHETSHCEVPLKNFYLINAIIYWACGHRKARMKPDVGYGCRYTLPHRPFTFTHLQSFLGSWSMINTVISQLSAPHIPKWGTDSSQVRPLTAWSSSSVILCPVVKYPGHDVSPIHDMRHYSRGIIPAVIFASISTLESAGIQDSGSSTRSWMGILRRLVTVQKDFI